jgi:hypothetical protein
MTHIEVPPIDPEREQALLAAFDAHWARPRQRTSRWSLGTAAALAAAIVGLNWLVVSNTPRVESVQPEPAFDMTGFVPWPGAEAWPRFESGSLVRVDLPVSALIALGLPGPFPTADVVQADIVVGQDGFARAVRLVQ